MKKLLVLAALVASTAVVSCSDPVFPADPPYTEPAITANSVRLKVTLPASVTASDNFVLAGSFKTNAWSPDKSTYRLVRNARKGDYWVEVNVNDFDGDLNYKVVRNANNGDAWKFVEKGATCNEIDSRILKKSDVNKNVEITVANFRNFSGCPD
jgi:hypothetical protein